MLHTYLLVRGFDTAIVLVRIAVIIAVTLTVPVVLFPVSRAVVLCFHSPLLHHHHPHPFNFVVRIVHSS